MMKSVIFNLILFIALLLFFLYVIFTIGILYPLFLIITIVLGTASFTKSKSTKVLKIPTDPLSGLIKLSYREFDRWATNNNPMNRHLDSFYSRTDVHWTEKMTTMFSSDEAARYCMEPSLGIGKLAFCDLLLGALIFIPSLLIEYSKFEINVQIILQVFASIIIGYFSGTSCGCIYRWIRGKFAADK